MMNKRSLYSACLGVSLIAGGAAWRKSISAEASELRQPSRPPRSTEGCRSVCSDFKIVCMEPKGAICVVHKEICISAETKCDLLSGK